MSEIHALGHKDCPILPSGEILCYQGSGKWQTNPLLTFKMLGYVLHALVHGSVKVKVGDRLFTPDGRWWYCSGRRTLDRVEKWSSSI